MEKVVLFADILGFGNLAKVPGAAGAADALSDLAHLLSGEDEMVARLLQPTLWDERYALSDSIFLVAQDAVRSCETAAEFFFNLAYVNHRAEAPVLLRGGIAMGEAFQVKPIFPESAKANLVGEAVVRAVKLEAGEPKGPRLLLSREVARALEDAGSWLLGHNDGAQAEILWLLPPDPSLANGLMIGEVCGTAFRLIREHGPNRSFGHHYRGYLELVTRSLERLFQVRPEEGADAVQFSGLRASFPFLEELALATDTPLVERLRALVR